MTVDWRNRFGRGWITSVRHQGGSANCWAFAMTALYEAMIRIEHLLWTRRSEGDMARGAGKQAWDLGNLGEAAIFVERYGLADPDCFPFSEAASLYTAKPHGASLSAMPLSPTPDRAGRTMRVPAGSTTGISDVAQKKRWIDLVGPMAVMIVPPPDFNAVSSGIYRPTQQGQGIAHALLVVGFDDDERYWIVKNSWGTGWGVGGFGRISYDFATLTNATFVGVRGTNPDPWARRRLRNGVLVQGGNGATRNNFELFMRQGLNIEHWYREHADPALPWRRVGLVRTADVWRTTFRDDALDCPAVVNSTFNRNYELVYRSNFRYLRHVYFDQASRDWYDATIFGPIDPVGIPGFVQSNRGAPGDFEVVVVTTTGQAEHWTKHNSSPWSRLPGTWYRQAQFGTGFAFGGPALVQSKLGVTGSPEREQGELHFVGADANGTLQHWARRSGTWTQLGTFGQGVQSGPCMIEGTYGAGNDAGIGNFELCVAVGGAIEHWWRHNASSGPWTRSATFGNGVRRVVGLLQSSFGTNLEVIAERTDGRFQHYWRGGGGWNAGVVIV
ncbi:MAG TPA: C1 family peptidase [Acidimicrobiales bacterium]|nr:C1 family peptidase [Acidimicrobiales bacterium]